jgi:hypothetical protein
VAPTPTRPLGAPVRPTFKSPRTRPPPCAHIHPDIHPPEPVDPFETIRERFHDLGLLTFPHRTVPLPPARRTSRCFLLLPSRSQGVVLAGGSGAPLQEEEGGGEDTRMASRSASKDIITLRGSAAIVSEFFGTHAAPCPLSCLVSFFAHRVPDEMLRFASAGYAANRYGTLYSARQTAAVPVHPGLDR